MAAGMHDIRWCPHCREDLSENIFERVPREWRRCRERNDDRVNAEDPLFEVITGLIPSALDCTVPNETRAKFHVEGSVGQGNLSDSPRYSFPTLKSVREGIFVCSQYEVQRNGDLGDYLVSIIVGRDGLRGKVPNTAAAMRDLVGQSREILGVDPGRRPRPQGSYRSEIVDQIEFPLRNPPTSEQFRVQLNRILTRVAVQEAALKALWDDVLAHPERYPADEQKEDMRRRGLRGEVEILRRERARLIRLGYPELAASVQKYPARGPNHDVSTFREKNGRMVHHYIEVKTTEKPRFRGKLSKLQTVFALQHPPEDTSIAIFTGEREDEPLGEPIILTETADKFRYFRQDTLRRECRLGHLSREVEELMAG